MIMKRPDFASDYLKQPLPGRFTIAKISETNPVLNNLLSEGCEDFIHYLKMLGFAEETNLMVLSSLHHYYYDLTDLKGIKILLSIRQLNHIIHIDSFLYTLARLLPDKAYFVGYFSDYKITKNDSHIGYPNKFLKGLFNRINSDNRRRMSENEVVKLLNGNGFRLIDKTGINGLTYFCSQYTEGFSCQLN